MTSWAWCRQTVRAPATATWRGFGGGAGVTGTCDEGKNIEERRLGTTDFFFFRDVGLWQRRGGERSARWVHGWVCAGWMRKITHFLKETLEIAIFVCAFIVIPPYPLLKTYDR
jgi:hypothetical protein